MIDCEVFIGKLIDESNKLVGMPGAGAIQASLMQAAGSFAIAGAINRLAVAVTYAAQKDKE